MESDTVRRNCPHVGVRRRLWKRSVRSRAPERLPMGRHGVQAQLGVLLELVRQQVLRAHHVEARRVGAGARRRERELSGAIGGRSLARLIISTGTSGALVLACGSGSSRWASLPPLVRHAEELASGRVSSASGPWSKPTALMASSASAFRSPCRRHVSKDQPFQGAA